MPGDSASANVLAKTCESLMRASEDVTRPGSKQKEEAAKPGHFRIDVTAWTIQTVTFISASLESCCGPRENGTRQDLGATNAHPNTSRRLSRNSGWQRSPSWHWLDRKPERPPRSPPPQVWAAASVGSYLS